MITASGASRLGCDLISSPHHTKGWTEPGVMELSVTSVLAGFSEPGGWSGGDIGIPFFFQLSASATMQGSLFWCFLLGNRTY